MTDYCRDNAHSTPVFRNDENQAICADSPKSACRGLLWYSKIEILPLLNILLTLPAYVLSRHQILAFLVTQDIEQKGNNMVAAIISIALSIIFGIVLRLVNRRVPPQYQWLLTVLSFVL
jgi:hypothetical protein